MKDEHIQSNKQQMIAKAHGNIFQFDRFGAAATTIYLKVHQPAFVDRLHSLAAGFHTCQHLSTAGSLASMTFAQIRLRFEFPSRVSLPAIGAQIQVSFEPQQAFQILEKDGK